MDPKLHIKLQNYFTASYQEKIFCSMIISLLQILLFRQSNINIQKSSSQHFKVYEFPLKIIKRFYCSVAPSNLSRNLSNHWRLKPLENINEFSCFNQWRNFKFKLQSDYHNSDESHHNKNEWFWPFCVRLLEIKTWRNCFSEKFLFIQKTDTWNVAVELLWNKEKQQRRLRKEIK